METKHRVVIGDSRELDRVEDDSVELIVTSPPYPMIEMWDEMFEEINPSIGRHLTNGNGRSAFDLMHEELAKTWREVNRAIADGGIACINTGDATRRVDGSFRVYPNHARVIEEFENLGFEPLPDILWRKPTNSAAKFMGSGMIPPNAYATLEHEYLLIFRKGEQQRTFEPEYEPRYNSAYFWEERNEWFSDVWKDVKGALQTLDNNELRQRSAAFPFEIPYRLINMYSMYGDTVLDPFWGTGTTSLAAMVAGRNSVGYELEEEFTEVFEDRVTGVDKMTRQVVTERLDQHKEFVRDRQNDGEGPGYTADNYSFPVMTKQEKQMQFYTAEKVERNKNTYTVTHEKVEGSHALQDSQTRGQTTLGPNSG
ncbi:MAG: Modification methylase MthZI [Methanonatronarchaeales archaeon]|nr:Modification methylase MthZI [Methanonatronarchaeales archaeon]